MNIMKNYLIRKIALNNHFYGIIRNEAINFTMH